ncbi:hypothetical protein BC940DRAFT_231953 [Gongronella butleri]|nr:hypothetical protein BC940DRAFT_231953 [Gongronella butleri]
MNFDPIKVKQVPPIPSAVVCHIDESALFEKQAGSAAKLAATCASKVPELSYTSVALQDMFSADFIGDPAFDTVLKKVAGSDEAFLVALSKESSTMSNEERLRALFKSINKNTAKEDLFWHLKLAMLLAMARREGCDYIFLGDTATRQSIKMISCISHGRGYSIPFDVGVEVEGCFPGVVLLRPMKDALTKEVAVYNHLHGLTGDVIAPQNFGTYMPPKSSIERLTEHFIVGLDRDFPSTVSTVSRTASKLTPQKNMDYTKKCAICLM